MIKVCIVEDEKFNAEKLEEYISTFFKKNNLEYTVDIYGDGLGFLEKYNHNYDLIFLDIQLPNIDGIETAHRLRAVDKSVTIIFVTNLLKYAIKGYEVQAFDYIVKPVNYYDFSVRMQKFVETIEHRNNARIIISYGVNKRCIDIQDIQYIDVVGHNICYHLKNEDILAHDSLSKAEQGLGEGDFARCNSGILVNLKYVRSLSGDSVDVGGKWLPVSRPKRKEFTAALTNYIAKNR